jgi:predicted NBD/HSP70 family sugar kinase
MPTPPKAPPATVVSATALLEHLRDGQPRTRAELAAITGLSRSTIAARLDDLLESDLIRPFGDATSTGGRPPSQFALNRTGRLLLCADLGASHATVAISDLTGAVLWEHTETFDIALGPELVLARVTEVADDLLSAHGRDKGALLGVGIGLPGPVEFSTGRPSNPPIMPGWHDYDVRGRLQRYVDVPVLVDNDVNIMALGERSVHFPDVDNLLFVKIGTGLGGGVISGGRLQRGAQGIAGDIGHIRILSREASVPCICGSLRCVGRFASGRAIAANMRSRGLDAADHLQAVELVRRGDPEAIAVVRQAGRDIGEMLHACISFANPSVIVIGGSVAQAGEHLIAGVREVVYAESTPLATEKLQIVASRAGARAGVIGAAALATERLLAPEHLESMVSA